MPISDELYKQYGQAMLDLEITQLRVNNLKRQIGEAMRNQSVAKGNGDKRATPDKAVEVKNDGANNK